MAISHGAVGLAAALDEEAWAGGGSARSCKMLGWLEALDVVDGFSLDGRQLLTPGAGGIAGGATLHGALGKLEGWQHGLGSDGL